MVKKGQKMLLEHKVNLILAMRSVMSSESVRIAAREGNIRRWSRPEEHEKQSKNQTLRFQNPQEREKLRNRKRTVEQRENISKGTIYAYEHTDLREKIHNAQIERYKRPGEKEKTSQIQKKRFQNPKECKKISASINLLHRTTNMSEKISKGVRSYYNSNTADSLASRKKISLALIKRHQQPNEKIRIKKWRDNIILPMKDSKCEVIVQDFLKQLNIAYTPHKYIDIEHGYQCDLFIPSLNLIIECDGDAIHFNPKKYIETDKLFKDGLTAKERWSLDKTRTKELLEKGYEVIRLWESDIKKMKLEEFQQKINRHPLPYLQN